ncbi:hypothetical protein DPEC_G00027960 [Dallia pectoralis]|uniref:Uncharacterized protein n=1 Tax=Dallia pectoralis TaxID=75939 RepID=A0ACC2HI94_DALPE|nr:hypothetical protein DPEC_G00027960 [Dallia pectoralis]
MVNAELNTPKTDCLAWQINKLQRTSPTSQRDPQAHAELAPDWTVETLVITLARPHGDVTLLDHWLVPAEHLTRVKRLKKANNNYPASL